MLETNARRWEALRCLLRDGKLEEVQRFERELSESPPDEPGIASAMRAVIEVATGKSVVARRKLTAAAKTRELSAPESLVLAFMLLEQGDLTGANERLKDAKKKGLRDPRIFSGAGQIALARGQT